LRADLFLLTLCLLGSTLFPYTTLFRSVIPEGKIQENIMLVPGTDGGKMSKSRGNIINIFLDDKKLRKQIMSIETDSTALEDPKDWSTCNCFAIYSLLASEDQIETMKANYEKGGYGYGHAKQAL